MPKPSCPHSLLPHAKTLCLVVKAVLCFPPAPMEMQQLAARSITCVGRMYLSSSVSPCPSCPHSFLPHDHTVPSTQLASTCPSPQANWRTGADPGQASGRMYWLLPSEIKYHGGADGGSGTSKGSSSAQSKGSSSAESSIPASGSEQHKGSKGSSSAKSSIPASGSGPSSAEASIPAGTRGFKYSLSSSRRSSIAIAATAPASSCPSASPARCSCSLRCSKNCSETSSSRSSIPCSLPSARSRTNFMPSSAEGSGKSAVPSRLPCTCTDPSLLTTATALPPLSTCSTGDVPCVRPRRSSGVEDHRSPNPNA
mmetsp:Transcript_27567/g.56496  ORF Transcript_27567/g.56496 Transcript_27567/m.56496 type:complete len:311 (-) Transcript_27567:1097-2029(-)